MSYLADEKVTIKVVGSEALDKIVYEPEMAMISVSYLNNPTFFYEHMDCGNADLDELRNYIAIESSATRGYNAWKERRKERLQEADRQMFDIFWAGLNEYQRESFYEWAQDKVLSNPMRNVPIYKHRLPTPQVTTHRD